MANQYEMEELFADFHTAAREAFLALESLFGVSDVYSQVFGNSGDPDLEKSALRASPAWAVLIALHDYALHGRPGGREAESIVIDGSGVLQLVTTEDFGPSDAWSRIVAMGDARFALDEGEDVEISRVALLAGVDVRTVRNAASAGELLATREAGLVFIENASARRWLAGRRGFRPTLTDDDAGSMTPGDVSTPAGFAALLQGRRRHLGLDDPGPQLVVLHPAADGCALAELESGVFGLPLDAVFPVADFYRLPRREFLACVMRVFFREELDVIVQGAGAGIAP